mmetsp:Transcript_80431/g.239637  ORF Transcript_80431/g.239637 Transcript_80431/m.239637 type:complete len:263 (+) Transcript_80431:56-844(+)
MAAEGAPTSKKRQSAGPLYIVEHMEEGMEDWCRLEYRHMCEIVPSERLLFLRFPAGVDPAVLAPEGGKPPRTVASSLEELRDATETAPTSGEATAPGAEAAPALPPWERICLLDMDAEEALEPEDCSRFDGLIFGGILGNVTELPEGGYGSDDRTRELRRLGFRHRRHLGPMQMTTDTAVLVCNMVLEEARPLAEIPFLDSPEIGGSSAGEGGGGGASDCICMEGFRYVGRRAADGDWEPTLPEGMAELLANSADGDILDSL